MDALAYDDFSGTGALQSRPTPYKANQRWVRAKSDSTYIDLILDGGELKSVLDDDNPYGTGYWLFDDETGDHAKFTHPFTVLVQFKVYSLAGTNSAVTLYTGSNAPDGGATRFYKYDLVARNVSGSAVVQRGSGPETPTQVVGLNVVDGVLAPTTVAVGANHMVMAVDSDGSVAYSVNGDSFGYAPSVDVVLPTLVGISCVGSFQLDAVTVYEGFNLNPSLDPPTPPEPPPPSGKLYWWTNRINVDTEELG